MAQTWQAVVGATTYNLNDGTISRLLPGVQGAGMPPARRLVQRSPQQHGHTDLGYRYDARQLRLPFLFDTTSLALADARRDDIYDIFKSLTGTPIKIKVTRDDASVRQLDCYVSGVVDMPDDLQNRLTATQLYVVTLEAGDPMWYNPTQQSTSFTNADNVDWWGALGTIAAANVEEHITSPTQGQVVSSGVSTATSSAFSVFFQTDVTTLTPSSNEAVLYFKNASAALTVVASLGTAGTQTITFNNGGVPAQFTSSLFDTGVHNYFLISTGSHVYIYRDSTLIDNAALANVYGITGSNSRWRSGDAGNTPWTPALAYAAIYDIALSPTQRTSIISAIGVYSASKTITYNGSFAEYPVITILGPITDPVLTNVSTDETLDFTGITIAAGNTYVIDCRFGYKTVKNTAGTNKIADLTAASDLATFHLGADPEVSGGANAFTLTGTGVTAATTVTVAYYNRYVGL